MELKYETLEEERIVIDKFFILNVNEVDYKIDFRKINKINKAKQKRLLIARDIEFEIKYQRIELEDKIFYLYTKNNKLYLTSNLNTIFRRKSNLKGYISKNNLYFYGLYSYIKNKFSDCDNVYINGNLHNQIIRPLNFWKFKHLAVIKISLEDIKNSGEIHSTIGIGDKNGNYLGIKIKKKEKGINYFARRIKGEDYFIIRSVISSSNIRIVTIPMSPEYKRINIIKNNIAKLIAKIIGKKNIILMFEKESRKANESGYYIFEKIMKLKNPKSKTYFVIDKNCDDFEKVYSKYPKNTLIKYTFKHYLYIYLSKYFISSELSNHVINPRLYIKSINREIAKKPLIFLQHGIMFAKPVDNPAAAGFQKNNSTVNFYKCIISSDLEATQFYKLGFDDEDLIKSGLTKFDVSKQSKDADKILLMFTYRYWEEALVMNPDTIKSTTYYKIYMKLIKEFEKNGLLDKLIISCHPKFADCIINAAPKYEQIVEKDINKGLENAKIFITDYSSASYDAHYRGSYIIYYWEEKDYLIENYKAIPPINEENCDGVNVYDEKTLIEEVQKAIKNNYVMPKKYQDRYKKINEFDDNKNGERLIKELKKLDII